MSKNKNLKLFFESLNNVSNIDNMENILRDLFQKEVQIKILNENDSENDYFYESAEVCEKLLNGKYVIATEREGHSVIFPLVIQDQLLGIIEFAGLTNSEIDFFEEILPVISLKTDNIFLKNQIQKNIEFHTAMKNIAKIIETQYELNFIIPIIGEILDTFISNHLVYIFLKSGGKEKLVYPTTCFDKNIIKTIENYNSKDEYVLNKSKLIGYFPLVSEQNTIGYLVTKSTEGKISPTETYYIQQLAKQVATTITRANVYSEILKHATLDALTGFYNRQQLDERIKQEISSAKRKHTSLCVIMTDIDFFKRVNDTYGHSTGDLVLKTVAKIIRTHLREYDIAARYGGEEFVIILPSTKKDEAQNVAERLRKAIEKKVIDIEKVNTKNEQKNISVTISLGVYNYKSSDKPANVIMNADKALYQAKENGRNQVVVFSESN